MADRLNPEKRSWNMAQIKSRNTEPEIKVRRVARHLKIRFQMHRNDLPGSPDIVFPEYRLAVFVHGCFWHRHKRCPMASTPKTRFSFWHQKFLDNTMRDKKVTKQIKKAGWHMGVIWQCQTKTPEMIEARLLKLLGRT